MADTSARWALPRSQSESDFKAGMWWSDAQDMHRAVDGIRAAGRDWETARSRLTRARAKIAQGRQRLGRYAGADAEAQNRALDGAERSLADRAATVAPVAVALADCATVIERGHEQMAVLWAEWQHHIADATMSRRQVTAMQPVISGMVQSMVDAAGALQQTDRTGDAGSAATEKPPAAAQAGAARRPLAGVTVVPPAGDATPAASASSAATAPIVLAGGVPPGAPVAAPATPTLAGISGGAPAPSPGPASVALPAPPPVTASVALPTAVPVTTGPMPGVPFPALATAVPPAGPPIAPAPAPAMATAPGPDASSPLLGALAAGMPLAPGLLTPTPSLAVRAGVRANPAPAASGAGAPADAAPPPAGVAAGLLGRAARDSDGRASFALARRRRPGVRDDGGPDRVRFLDEDAWRVDDQTGPIATNPVVRVEPHAP